MYKTGINVYKWVYKRVFVLVYGISMGLVWVGVGLLNCYVASNCQYKMLKES